MVMQNKLSQQGQSSMMIIIIAVIVIILGGVAFFLTQNKSSNSTTETPTTTTQEAEPTAIVASPTAVMEENTEGTMEKKAEGDSMTDTGKTVTFEVTGSGFKFAPNTLTVNQGDTVKVVFKNSGGIHDFVIDEFNVATKKIGSGESEEVSFVADKKGSFEFYCSVGNHRQMGMKGTLTVK